MSKRVQRKLIGEEGERAVADLLQKHGRTVEHMGEKCHYDLTVDGCWKVEVKTANCSFVDGAPAWQFRFLRNGKMIEEADFYILRLQGVPFSMVAIHLLVSCPQNRPGMLVTFRALLNGLGRYAEAFNRFAGGLPVEGAAAENG